MRARLLNDAYLRLMKGRLEKIERFSSAAGEVQRAQLRYLVERAADTEYGRRYGFDAIRTEEDFRRKVPLITYEGLQDYVERLMRGENYLLWPDKITSFAKSSGTTRSKSKYIPVSREAFQYCHIRGGKDLFALYIREHPESGIFYGRNVSLGGSLHPSPQAGIVCGDVSALITCNLPFWTGFRRSPRREIALLHNWEDKLEGMVKDTLHRDVRGFLGVPSWMMLYLERTLAASGKDTLREVWPNMELFVHGGVSFDPYRTQFKALMGEPFRYLETYNASEGFFGIQDSLSQPDMLLMLDYGIYYEFVPVEETEKEQPRAVGIEDVEVGRNYALAISSNAGLWRYLIGDTVMFTSVRPYRFRISGRTRHFINTFGEELIVENADKALSATCTETGIEIRDYTAAPVFLDNRNRACHQWLVEFVSEPADLRDFSLRLDKHLKEVNSDYEAKRSHDLMLKQPQIIPLPQGTFLRWLEAKGKLGGQHKVPRLSNNRELADEILSLAGLSDPETKNA